MPGAFGDYCPPCALQRKLDAYHQSPEYLAWKAALDAFQAGVSSEGSVGPAVEGSSVPVEGPAVEGSAGPVGVVDVSGSLMDIEGATGPVEGTTGATEPDPPPLPALSPEEALAAWYAANPQPTMPQ
jgi:hypothetical protein